MNRGKLTLAAILATCASATVTPSQVGTDVSFDVTAAVQAWSDGSLAPNGFMLTTSVPIRALFGSKETGFAPTLEVTAGDTPGREVLDLSSLPVNIDDSGKYVHDRDWNLGDRAGTGNIAVTVNADDVLIDFRGFSIRSDHQGTIIEVVGDDVDLRNGSLSTFYIAARSTGQATTLADMDVYSDKRMTFTGGRAVVRDSRIRSGGFGVTVGPNGIFEGNDLHCEGTGGTCLTIEGTDTKVRGNRLAATVPFELNGTTQTDWGGNVGY